MLTELFMVEQRYFAVREGEPTAVLMVPSQHCNITQLPSQQFLPKNPDPVEFMDL